MALRKALLPESTWSHPHPVMCLQRIAVRRMKRENQLWLIGIDHRGASMAVYIQDFRPSFLVRAPTDWEKDEEDCAVQLDEFIQVLNTARPDRFVGSIEYSLPLLGFTNGEKERMVRVSAASIDDYNRAKKSLSDDNFEILHKDFSFAAQFIHQTRLQYDKWVQLTDVSLRSANSSDYNSANLVGTAKVRQCQPLTVAPPRAVPSALKLFIRAEAVSRDGMVHQRYAYRADASLPLDRVVCIALYYVWAHDPQSGIVSKTVLSLIPDQDANTQVFEDETQLLEAFRQNMLGHDPDEIYLFPDVRDDLWFIVDRMKTLKVVDGLRLGRFQHQAVQFKRDRATRSVVGVRFDDRNVIDMQQALKSKPWIPVDVYDLHSCSGMDELRKCPVAHASLLSNPNVINQWMVTPKDRHLILQKVRQDVELMVYLERDNAMRLEFTNLGQICDTDYSDIVNRGQQLRVYQKLTHFCHDEHYHINKRLLSSKPLRFNIKTRPPTYPDAPALPINAELRERANADLRALLKSKKKRKEAKAKEVEGGSVLDPAPRFYGKTPVAVLDFNSLYPSIMTAFGICPSNLVYDAKYMDLPGVDYIFVAVNAQETVAYAKRPGIVPKLLRLLVDSRTAIRKKQAVETDYFAKAVYDKMQLAMKTVCNATYGFFGAGQNEALFPVKDIMYSVTSIGRYLQRQCVYYLGLTYSVPTVYGDTDSVFVIAPLIEAATIEEIAAAARTRYRMGDDFSWQTVVKHFSKLDMTRWTLDQQCHALLYLIFEKLSAECTTLFPPPIVLGFENLLIQLAMYDMKKTYYGHVLDERDPSRVNPKKPTKVTGMAMKKRDWCHFTRSLLKDVAYMILNQQLEEIKPYLDRKVEDLVAGRVPKEQLIITKRYDGPDKYKTSNVIHVQLVKKMEQRQRSKVAPKSRLPFLVLRGKEQLYMRAEEPDVVKSTNQEPDLKHYLRNQLEKPLRRQLLFHSDLFDMDRFFTEAEQRIVARQDGIFSLTDTVRSRPQRTLAGMRAASKRHLDE